MTEKKRRNPFEDHIESEQFDVSGLDATLDLSDLGLKVQDFLDHLAHPYDTEVWDEELNDQQKQLCAHLVNALIDRYVRTECEDELGHLEDEELIVLLTTPVAMALLAQQRILSSQIPAQPAAPEVPPAPVTPAVTEMKSVSADWKVLVSQAIRSIGQVWNNLMSRFRQRL